MTSITIKEDPVVGVKTIDANMLKNMFLAGAKRIESKKEWINELNVFPVPDGDTGTNMTMTIMSAAREVSALADPDMGSLSKAIPVLFCPSYSVVLHARSKTRKLSIV